MVYPCLSHLARAALRAMAFRSSAVSFAARAVPRLVAASLTTVAGVSSTSWVAIWPMRNASSFRSRGRGGVEGLFGMGEI